MIAIADRFWIGNGGDWDDTAHWSTSSGGSGGASVPTSADNVFFDANSFNAAGQTITATSYAYCLNMDWTGITQTASFGTLAALRIYGSLTLVSNVNFDPLSISFLSTATGNTVTSSGVVISKIGVSFNGAGGEWTLQDDLATDGAFSALQGTVNTNSKAISCTNFNCNGTGTRTLVLGSSVITCSGGITFTTTGLTLTANTSTFKIIGNTKTLAGGGISFNNVELSGTPVTITGSNTFNDLKLTAGITVNFTAGETQTVTALSGDGSNGNLVTIQSTLAGSAFTLSKASGEVNKSYYSIKDCTATGGAKFIAWNSTNVSGNTGWHWGKIASDTGSSVDTATISATLGIADGHQHTQLMAIGMGYAFNPAVDSGRGVDVASVVASLTASDTGSGLDALLPINASINASDTGTGVDIGTVAKAYYLIDENNILQPLGVFVMRGGKEELAPKTRDYTEDVPGRHGEIDFGSDLQPRVLEFKVHINTTPAEKTALKRRLAAYLNPLNGVKPLIDSADIEKTYYVKYAGNIDLDNYVNAMQFTIPFKASDPIIYGSFEKTQIGSGTITNDGTLPCPVQVTIVGAVTNPSVVIGSYTLAYTGALTASDTLVIDTGALTCTLNEVNAIGNLTGLTTDVVLAVGDTVVTAPANGTTTIRYREQFI